MPKALITGLTGQDGSYLAELLLGKGYEVHGTVRRSSTENFERIEHLRDRVQLHQADLLDQLSLIDVLQRVEPDEVYNLAAMSFVPTSWGQPVLTGEFTALGVTRMLEAVRSVAPRARFYQASSSVDGATPVLVRRHGITERIPIQDLVPSGIPSDFVTWPLQATEILSVDDQARVTFLPAGHVSRHLKDRLYTLTYDGGGELKITGDHSIIVFGAGGALIEKRVDELKVGDYLITSADSRANAPRLRPQGIMVPESTASGINLSARSTSVLGTDPAGQDPRWGQTSLECLPSSLFRPALEGVGSDRIKTRPLVSKDTLKRLIRTDHLTLPEPLERLLDSSLGVTTITAIRSETGRFRVYDVSVPQGQRFFGGNLPVLCHNSEMFGKVRETPQTELTPFYPRSPYGVAKVYGHFITINYRESYNLFCCSGILFNHESQRRGKEFVTRKVTHGAARIKLGLQAELRLGNLEARRDWGYAPDYVRAMWLMLQQDQPSDYVVATGAMHTVQELVELAFDHVGLDWRNYVRIDPALKRPAEVDLLCGDPTKARTQLQWQPEVSFAEMIRIMVDSDLRLLAGKT